MDKLKELQELRRMQAQAGELASSLENCGSTAEAIEALKELGLKLFTWKADTCYINGKKRALGGACKIFSYWQGETVDYIKRVDYMTGVVMVSDKGVGYMTVTAPLSPRIRALIGRY